MSDDNQLTVRRTFDPPRKHVWRTFTDPNELEQWFVPEGRDRGPYARPHSWRRNINYLNG